jgi:hypothetical protein
MLTIMNMDVALHVLMDRLLKTIRVKRPQVRVDDVTPAQRGNQRVTRTESRHEEETRPWDV